ncbi:hypothetical protein YC2023_077674 [Brassica napus]
MEEELRDMKAHKAYISQVDFVANAQQGIPQLCPCTSIMKRTVDEVDTYDYLPGKRFFICKDFENDGLHVFSTQSPQESTVKERRKWSVKEDLILIGSWLNTSKDSIVSNEQKGAAFWKRIVSNYNSSPLLLGTVPREIGQCKQRWARINELVCKFCGCYDMALREQRSGQNENDVMKAALDIFNSDQNMKFTLEHAWRELRHDVKWCSTYMEKDKDKRKAPEVHVPEPEDRPVGVKAAKAAGKRQKTRKDEEFSQLEGLMEMKKQISRQSLLERLLAKPEPLDEMESALKNKLLSELLS